MLYTFFEQDTTPAYVPVTKSVGSPTIPRRRFGTVLYSTWFDVSVRPRRDKRHVVQPIIGDDGRCLTPTVTHLNVKFVIHN